MNRYDRNYSTYSQQAFTDSKPTIETLEKDSKYGAIYIICAKYH